MNKNDFLTIIRILLIALAFLGIVLLILGPARINPGLTDNYTAELIMPGNTIVEGTCDKVIRIGNNWSKYHINGKWYACADFRVVLKEEN